MPRALDAKHSAVEHFITESGVDTSSFTADAFAALAQAHGRLIARLQDKKIQSELGPYVQVKVNNCIAQLRFGPDIEYDDETTPALMHRYSKPIFVGSHKNYPIHYDALFAFSNYVEHGLVPGFQQVNYESTPIGDIKILTAKLKLDALDFTIENLVKDTITEGISGTESVTTELYDPQLRNRFITVTQSEAAFGRAISQSLATEKAYESIERLLFDRIYFEGDNGKTAFLTIHSGFTDP
jgi:hypothetical protein